MSEVMPDFKLMQPVSVDEAVGLLAKDTSARICAGGTDLIVNMRRGLVDTKTLVDLNSLDELKRISFDNSAAFIGAGVTLNQVAEDRNVAKQFAAVTQACQSIAGPSHRQAATVGGNLCLDTRCLYYNQSHWWRKSNGFCLKYRGEICHVAPKKKQCRAAFSGDLAPALIVHDAVLEIAGPEGRRRVAINDFYREDGMDHLTLKPAEIVVGVHLQPSTGTSGYSKIRLRGAIDFPLAGVAISCRETDTGTLLRIAVTGTNSRPVLVDMPSILGENDDLEEYYNGLAKAVQMAVTPLRTTTMPANYRRLSVSATAKKLAQDLLKELRAQ